VQNDKGNYRKIVDKSEIYLKCTLSTPLLRAKALVAQKGVDSG